MTCVGGLQIGDFLGFFLGVRWGTLTIGWEVFEIIVLCELKTSFHGDGADVSKQVH